MSAPIPLVLHLDLDTLRFPAGLTQAERDVLLLVMEGLSNEEIARRRQRSERTIANQLAAMMRKAGVFNRTELLARCAREHADGRGWEEFVEGRWYIRELARTQGVVRCVAEPNPQPLTREERLIVEQASRGTPNKLLADVLELGESAATKCLERALRKLGVTRRTHLPVLRAVFS